MKHLLLASVWLSLVVTPTAHAISISSINGIQGAQICKQQIKANSRGSELNFQRQSASSFRGSSFTYWINAYSKIGEERGPLRYRCEISRSGELIEIVEEGGRWNI